MDEQTAVWSYISIKMEQQVNFKMCIMKADKRELTNSINMKLLKNTDSL